MSNSSKLGKVDKTSTRTELKAEPRVEIDSEVTRSIRQHARSHPKAEVCGVLIGEKTDSAIEIRFSIEASSAAQAGTHVTFTQEAWEEIYRVKDQRYPDARIVGWYHSHPGFGVFLSEHDLFIQQNFFSSVDQVAWVYDPHTDEEGCFGWVNGEIHRLSSLAIADRNGDGTERTPKRMDSALLEEEENAAFGEFGNMTEKGKQAQPEWMRWLVMGIGYAAMLILGFATCFFLRPPMIVIPGIDPVSGKVVLHEVPPELRPYLDGRVPLPPEMMAPADQRSVPPAGSLPSAPSSAPAVPPVSSPPNAPAPPSGRKP